MAERGAGPSRGCVFCVLVADPNTDLVVRTPDVVGFLDRRPLFRGHTLVLPREHVPTLGDLPDDLVSPLFGAARSVARAMPEALGAQGSFVAMNNVVSQSVPHLHVHVVPRTKGDGLRGFFWPRTTYAAGEAATYAARLRAALADPEPEQ